MIEKAHAEARRTLTALAGDAPVVGLETLLSHDLAR
jgi:hypothetical protein